MFAPAHPVQVASAQSSTKRHEGVSKPSKGGRGGRGGGGGGRGGGRGGSSGISIQEILLALIHLVTLGDDNSVNLPDGVDVLPQDEYGGFNASTRKDEGFLAKVFTAVKILVPRVPVKVDR